MLEAIEREVKRTGDLGAAIDRHFADAPSVSIDQGVLEECNRLYMLEGRFGWSDVGNWDAVWKLSSRDARGNSIYGEGVAMDSDLNNYDTEHACTAHTNMSRQEWEAIYHEAWSLYYTPEHIKTLLRRTAATGGPMGSLVKLLFTFSTTDRLDKVHPLQSGILRLKHPSERRPGLPPESPWIFWPRFVWETVYKHAILVGMIGRLLLWKTAIALDPDARSYMDQALTPVRDDEDVTLDLLTKTTGARVAVAHVKKVAELTGGGRIA